MRIELREAACRYHDKVIVDGLSAGIDAESVWCLLGSNGIGRTMLFKAVPRLSLILSGKVPIGDHDIHDFGHAEFARLASCAPQPHMPPLSLKIPNMVVVGHTTHLSTFAILGRGDFRIAAECLEHLKVAHLTERVYAELSGGEQQLVPIARALAQQSRFITVDEPAGNLDFGNQVRVLRVVKHLTEEGYGVVMTTHFPDHVFQCETLVSLTTRERRYLHGTASEVLTPGNLALAYGIRVAAFDTDYERRQLRHVQPLDDSCPNP